MPNVVIRESPYMRDTLTQKLNVYQRKSLVLILHSYAIFIQLDYACT